MAALPLEVAAKYSPLSGLTPANSTPPLNPASFHPAYTPTTGGLGTSSEPITGGISFGGSPAVAPQIPNYGSLIQQDPALLQSEAMLNGQGVANQAQRNAAFQTDVTQYGEVPDLATAAKALGLSATDLGNFLGPNIQQLAKENTDAGTSTIARLSADNTKAIQGIRNALAARGIYNSGETGYQLGQQQQAYQNAGYDALQKLLGGMDTAQQSYLTAEQQRLEALAQALSDAANRVQTEYPPTPGSPAVPATTASYIGTNTRAQPVYQDSNGNLYNQDGSAYQSIANDGSLDLAPAPQTPQYVASHTQRYGI